MTRDLEESPLRGCISQHEGVFREVHHAIRGFTDDDSSGVVGRTGIDPDRCVRELVITSLVVIPKLVVSSC